MTDRLDVMAAAASAMGYPSVDKAFTTYKEFRKTNELTLGQLQAEMAQLRLRLENVFSDSKAQLKQETNELKQAAMKELTLIWQDYDFLEVKRAGWRAKRFPSKRQLYQDIVKIYNRLNVLLHRTFSPESQILRNWEEQYELEMELYKKNIDAIRLRTDDAPKDVNEEFLSRTVLMSKPDLKRNGAAKNKRKAVRSLRELSVQSNRSRDEIVKQGAIVLLIPLIDPLGTVTPFLKQDIVCTLGNLAFANDANCEEIKSKGGIGPLVDLLSGRGAQPEYAAYALGRIAQHVDVSGTITGDDNAIQRLVDLLRSNSSIKRWTAAFALGRLTDRNKKCRAQVLQADAIPMLVSLLTNEEPFETAYAPQTLGNLMEDRVQVGFYVINEGSTLVRMLNGTRLQKEYAAYALAQLAHSGDYGSRIDAMDGITPLVVLLDGHEEQAHHAAKALALLSENSSESCKKIAGSGGIGPLSGLLHAKTPQPEKIFGTRALGKIALVDEATRSKIVQYDVVPRLFKFHLTEGLKSHALYALSTIATDLNSWKKNDSNQVIKAMINLLRTEADDEIKEYAAAILKPLCFSEHEASVLYAVEPMLYLLRNGTDGQKTNASAVLANLSSNQSNHHAIVNWGALGPLAMLLPNRSDAQKDNALSALVNIVTKPSENTAFADVVFQGFSGTNIIASLRDLIYDGTEQQVVKVVRVLGGLLEYYNAYQAISTGAPGTYRALVYLKDDGTARQKALATGVIDSFATIKEEMWYAVEHDVIGTYPVECRPDEENEIEQKRTNLGPI